MAPLVRIAYVDLVSDEFDMGPALEQAFGPEGLGIIAIYDVPGYVQARLQLLPLIAAFASLPDSSKQLYELPETLFSVGWSCGKEFLAKGKPDIHKGSYYANPTVEKLSCSSDLQKRFPAYYHDNIWPTEHLPELQPAFNTLAKIIVEQGLLLAQHCDRFIASRLNLGSYSAVTNALHNSQCCKARLLHYFAPPTLHANDVRRQPDTPDDWCGWHLDHGCLTGLTCAMYIKDGEPVECPDAAAGLYIKARSGEVVQVSIPPDHIAFQVGETLQVLSGGVLMATPHCVRSATHSGGVSRNTLAVFMQPDMCSVMVPPPDVPVDQIGVGRWRPGISFGVFSDRTLKTYYPGHAA